MIVIWLCPEIYVSGATFVDPAAKSPSSPGLDGTTAMRPVWALDTIGIIEDSDKVKQVFSNPSLTLRPTHFSASVIALSSLRLFALTLLQREQHHTPNFRVASSSSGKVDPLYS